MVDRFLKLGIYFGARAGITFFSMAIKNTYKKKKTYEADARCAEIGNKKYLYAQFPNCLGRK